MLKSQDEEVLTLWIQHPLVRSSMKTIWQVQKRKIHQVQKREFIKAKKKGNPSRRDKILRKHQIVRNKKEKAIKLEKTSIRKNIWKEKSAGISMKMKEKWFIKRHKRNEISWKITQVEKDEQNWRFIKSKIQSNWVRQGKKKLRYISSKKWIQSSQEKWKCIRKDKRVSRRNANSSRKDGSLSNWKKQKM